MIFINFDEYLFVECILLSDNEVEKIDAYINLQLTVR